MFTRMFAPASRLICFGAKASTNAVIDLGQPENDPELVFV